MFYRLLLPFLVLLLVPGISFSENADQLERRFEPKVDPKSGFGSALPELKKPSAIPDSFPDGFELRAVEVVGSTVYADEDLEPIYTSYLHRPANPDLLEELAAEIAQKYEADGYPYANVSVEPPSTPRDAPRIIIHEAYIDNVVIQGEVKDKKGRFASLADKIKAMRPIYKPTMERYLLLASDLAGIYKIEPKIEASEGSPGAYTLTLEIKPMKTTSGFVYIDNRGTESVGPSTFVPGLFISNPFGYFSKTSILLATTAQTKELRYLSAGYDLPVNDNGTTLQLKASYNKSYPGNSENPSVLLDLEAIDFNSSSATLSVGLEHPFIRTQQKNFTGYGKFDIKYADTKNDVNAPPGLQNTKDETRVFRLGGSFDYSDSTNAITQLQLEWSRGLDGLGATSNDSTTKSRDDGVVDFDKLTYSISRTQPLTILSPELDKWTMYAALEGQISNDGLLSGEECGIGGASFGRAYDTSEIVGERCISAGVELSRSFDTSGIEWLTSSKGFMFYDVGSAKQKDESDNQSLSSAGLGMEIKTSKNVTLSVELAKPLTRKVANEDNKDLRVFGTVTIMF